MIQKQSLNSFHPSLKLLSLIIIIIGSFLMFFLLGFAVAIPFFGLDMLESITLSGSLEDPDALRLLKYFQVVNQVGVFIIPAMIFALLVQGNIRGYLKLREIPSLWIFLASLLLIFLSLPFINWMLEWNSDLSLPASLAGLEGWFKAKEEEATKLTELFLETTSCTGFLFNLFMIAVLAAMGEEMIFRGIILRLFREWTKNVHLAVLISAVLFSAFHLQFYGFFPRIVLGIILGYLYVWSGSLWVPIFVHFMNNAMAVFISWLDNNGVIEMNIENFGSSESTLMVVSSFILSLGTMYCIYHFGMKKGPPTESLPNHEN